MVGWDIAAARLASDYARGIFRPKQATLSRPAVIVLNNVSPQVILRMRRRIACGNTFVISAARLVILGGDHAFAAGGYDGSGIRCAVAALAKLSADADDAVDAAGGCQRFDGVTCELKRGAPRRNGI